MGGRAWGGTLVAGMAAATLFLIAPAGAAEDPAVGYQWALDKVRAQQAWDTGEGEGIVIAILDTGVDLHHEDLAGQLVPGRNILTPTALPQDDNGRGTHVAGIAAAITGNGKGVAGVAPEAKIMPIKSHEDDGSAAIGNIVAGIRWAADNGADVINVSINSSLTGVSTNLRDAVRYAWSKGSIPVLSAGNQALVAASFSDEPAIIVGATTRTDEKPEYASSVGSAQWGISAPGGADSDNDEEDILSTYWPHTGTEGGQPRQYGRYAYLAGTAQAAPHVAGAAAILRGLGLTPSQTVDRLLATARDIGPPGRDSTFGAGCLDVTKAVAGLRPAGGSGTSSSTTSTSVVGETTTSTAAGTTSTTTRRPQATRPPRAITTAPMAPTTSSSTTVPGQPLAISVEDETSRSPVLAILIAAFTIAALGGATALWRRFGGA